jgi:hypothetical protein
MATKNGVGKRKASYPTDGDPVETKRFIDELESLGNGATFPDGQCSVSLEEDTEEVYEVHFTNLTAKGARAIVEAVSARLDPGGRGEKQRPKM